MRKFFKKAAKKIRAKAGETLVETLVAIVICTFASTLLANGVATASKLNKDARADDAKFQSALAIVEARDEAADEYKEDDEITIKDLDDESATDITIDVTYVKSGDTTKDLASYFTVIPS